MNKVREDGRVAVLYSPSYGAGWYTWNIAHPECLFDPDIVEMVRSGAAPDEIGQAARDKWNQGDDYFYSGGADALMIRWVSEGERFRISEYDGSERVITEAEELWITA